MHTTRFTMPVKKNTPEQLGFGKMLSEESRTEMANMEARKVGVQVIYFNDGQKFYKNDGTEMTRIELREAYLKVISDENEENFKERRIALQLKILEELKTPPTGSATLNKIKASQDTSEYNDIIEIFANDCSAERTKQYFSVVRLNAVFYWGSDHSDIVSTYKEIAIKLDAMNDEAIRIWDNAQEMNVENNQVWAYQQSQLAQATSSQQLRVRTLDTAISKVIADSVTGMSVTAIAKAFLPSTAAIVNGFLAAPAVTPPAPPPLIADPGIDYMTWLGFGAGMVVFVGLLAQRSNIQAGFAYFGKSISLALYGRPVCDNDVTVSELLLDSNVNNITYHP
jgi:hypothetical protein